MGPAPNTSEKVLAAKVKYEGHACTADIDTIADNVIYSSTEHPQVPSLCGGLLDVGGWNLEM